LIHIGIGIRIVRRTGIVIVIGITAGAVVRIRIGIICGTRII
jgi:hypothetical protein|tara:strand:+ start:70 stop:195 length:126 start_codon:yes stop_codon:yes gene_type:complete